ncbi:hypothetical protein TetV_503 [Tetraselmis virus 1]|uniref:Uncharacterized protein n=1 Tax=Tetraselmis virus 1 TaxID=2060617 RepID=A0A2P0VNU5_9VIRU|nr:hypothetical protein QJ968_gp551 [Tetraselmis virus 1]AUF82585.1 hypothetical protein TetV_503 [Tetraselmis virus 1]
MSITQVLLYVSDTPTIPETATEDVTAQWNYDNVVTYIVGKAYTLKYYWVKITDIGGNDVFYSLGSYRTQDNTDPVVTGSLSKGVPTTTQVVFNHGISDNSDQFTSVHCLLTTDSGAKTFSDISTNGREIPWNSLSTTFDALTKNTTYYGWIAAEDSAGNQTVFDGSSITTDDDTAGPVLSSYTFTATAGLEETHVDIALSIDEVNEQSPQYSSLTTTGSIGEGFGSTTFTLMNKTGVFINSGYTWTYRENAPFSVWKADNGNVIIYQGYWFMATVVTNGWDPYTANDGDTFATGDNQYEFLGNGSDYVLDSVTGHRIPAPSGEVSYTTNPNQSWSQYSAVTLTGQFPSSLNTTYQLVYGFNGTYDSSGYSGPFNFYKPHTMWISADKTEFIGYNAGSWYAVRPSGGYNIENVTNGDQFTVDGLSDYEAFSYDLAIDVNTNEYIPSSSSDFNYD